MTVPNQGQFRAGVLTRFIQEWSDITDDPVTLQAIKGVKLPMTSKPPVRRPTKAELSVRRDEPAIDAAIKVAPIQVLVLVSLINPYYSLGVATPGGSEPSGRAGKSVHFPRLHSPKAGERDRIRKTFHPKPQSKWFLYCSRAETQLNCT